MLVIKAVKDIMLLRITNREDPDQTASKQSDQGLHCLSRPFLQATTVSKFLNIYHIYHSHFYVAIGKKSWERSGSVVECLTRDRRAVGSSLTGVTALCP